MIIYTRNDNTPLETQNTINPSISMNGKWLLDHPDGISVASLEGTPTQVLEREIKPQILSLYPSYDHVYYDALLDSSSVFDSSALFPKSTGFTPSRVKVGVIPNVACLLSKNDTQGAGREGVAISYEIDITALTSDGLGRQTFFPYWRAVTKSISTDIIPVNGVSATNQPSRLTYTEATSSQYSVYLSGDNGNTYESVSLLTPFSFNDVKDTIRVAFVNESASDIYLLSYALMF